MKAYNFPQLICFQVANFYQSSLTQDVLRPFADPFGWAMDCDLFPRTVSRTRHAPLSLTRIFLAISACSTYFLWQLVKNEQYCVCTRRVFEVGNVTCCAYLSYESDHQSNISAVHHHIQEKFMLCS